MYFRVIFKGVILKDCVVGVGLKLLMGVMWGWVWEDDVGGEGGGIILVLGKVMFFFIQSLGGSLSLV